MPIKKDQSGKRWVEMELVVPGTPEQVWHAMATGPGNAAWFAQSKIEPRVGGLFALDFGQGVNTQGEVNAWQPPTKFAYVERDWEPGAPEVLTEITIIGRSGNQCVLRMVHSLLTASDKWDEQLEGFENGWTGYFAVLRVYLRHFAGASAATFTAIVVAEQEPLAAWTRLGSELGLLGANVDERRTCPAAPESWTGKVEHIHQDAQQRWVVLRVESPSPGAVLVGTYAKQSTVVGDVAAHESTNVSLCRYFYGDGADAAAVASESKWRQWLSATFDITPAPV